MKTDTINFAALGGDSRSKVDRVLNVLTAAVVGLVGIFVVSLMATDSGPGDDFVENLASHTERALLLSPARSVEEALPTVRHSGVGRLSDLAVTGELVAIEPGKSFRWEFDNSVDEGTERRIEVPFDSKDAMVSTYHLTIRVASSLDDAGQASSDDTVRVGISVRPGSDAAELGDSISKRGTIFALLSADSPVYNYEKSLFSVSGNGAWIGFVDNRGVVNFPSLEEEGGPRAFNRAGMKARELLSARPATAGR